MKLLLLVILATMLCGCAGSHCRVVARNTSHPISFTACVLNSTGGVHKATTNEVMNHFRMTRKNWSMFWASVPLNATEWDLAPELEGKLKESSGNAVVNLTVRATGPDVLHRYFAALIPFVPTYVNVSTEGDIACIQDVKP
jgi:hypothetical protein